jgi:GTPase involved in cell partitioning and DNA repair
MPDGGSGGHGGDVYFRSTGRITSLFDLRRAHFFGNDGGYGKVRSIKRHVQSIYRVKSEVAQ